MATLTAAAAFSGAVALAWQVSSVSPPEEPAPFIDPSILAAYAPAEQQGSEAPVPPEEPVQNPSGQEAAPISEPEPAMPVPPGEVPLMPERVGSSYFDDAAFVGDSLTTGIKLYDVMQNADVFAGTGISMENVYTKTVATINGEECTILRALELTGPKKIYLMMGANSLASSTDYVLEKYGALVDEIIRQHPDSILYIQSCLPLYEPTFAVRYGKQIDNAQIAELNAGLCAMAAEKGVYYLDVASAFRDESGAMPKEYTPDGLHINSPQYTTWFDYLKTHAVVQ